MPMTIDVRDLGPLGPQLGQGGEAEVVELRDIPGAVFKRYTGNEMRDLSAIDRLIQWRNGLDPDAQRVLDDCTTWPTHRVMEGRRLVGVLMPRLADEYLADLSFGSVRGRRPRELQYLLRPDTSARLGLPTPSYLQRWDLAQRFAEVAAVLDPEVILGDQSEKNSVWTISPTPSVVVIDCDAARLDGYRGVGRGKESPGWEDPTLQGQEPDLAAARYKTFLTVHRCLAGEGASTPTEADVRRVHAATPGLADLLLRGLFAGRRDRPAMSELLQEFNRTGTPTPLRSAATTSRPKISVGHTTTPPAAATASTRPTVPVAVAPAQPAAPAAGPSNRPTVPVGAAAAVVAPRNRNAAAWRPAVPLLLLVPLLVVIILVIVLAA